MPEFKDRLRLTRRERGLTQVVTAAAVGTDERSYQRYESGSQQPTLPVLRALADFFDVSLDYLVGRSDDPARR